MVTNVVNTLTQLGYTSDLEAEAGLSSTTRKLSPQLREQWLQYMQDRRLLRGNLIIFKEWLASKAAIHENLLAQTNSSFHRNKFQSRDKPKTSTFASNAEESSKPKNFECPFKDGQHPIWTCEKFKSLKVNERREHVQKFRLFQFFETRSHVEGLQKQDLQRTQLWKAAQQAFAQRTTEEGNYKECLRCYNGSSN